MALFDSNIQKLSVKWWQSLRFILIIVMISVSVIPIIVITLLLSNSFRQQMMEQVTAQLESVSTLKVAEIDSWLDMANNQLDIIAKNPLTNLPLLTVLLSESTNTSRINTINETLAIIADESSVLESIFIYDLDGRVVLASQSSDVGKIVSRQPYFAASIISDEFYLQPPFYDISNTELTIIGSAPIFNSIDRQIGVIAARIHAETLSTIMLERSGLGESGETYLVSHDNNYFLTPSRFEGYSQNRAYSSYGIEKALNQQNGSGLYDDYRSPPVPVIGVYRWIPQLQSAMLVEIDENEALATFNQSILSGGQTMIAVGILVTLMGFFISGQIAHPIIELSQTAQAIASGDLSRRTAVQGQGEIVVLGQSFNHMADALERNISELDTNIQKTEDANRELAKQTALAREAARLKSEFLATMSHELRTPLNAITGFTGIILFDADILDDDMVHMLQRVESNAIRLLTLIDDVLDLSKIEAGRVEIVEEPIHIPTLVDQWVAETSILAENKNLPLEVEVVAGFPEKIFGDSARLTQIAKNLLSNAIKFTDQGYVKLSVGLTDTHWNIKVEDTGIGIAPHAQNYIFDEFRQVDGSTKRVYGGTGLGLTISRNLVLLMNGTLNVSSELGKGSTFTVKLPLRVTAKTDLTLAD